MMKFLYLTFLGLLLNVNLFAQDMAAVETTSIIETTPTTEATPVEEEEEEEGESGGLTLSGSVDAYFKSNFNGPNSGDFLQTPNTAFANKSGFGLGMINLVGTYETGKTGMVADLVFGPRGGDAVFGAQSATANLVNQLYVYYNVSDKVTLSFGNFNTFLGYEVISPTANFNYSTSYMFSWGPFSHSGIKADFALADKLSLMLGVFNPTDLTDFNLVNTYTLGAQLGYSGDAASVYLNFVYGDQDGTLNVKELGEEPIESAGALFQADLTAGFDVSEDFFLGVNATVNSTATGEIGDAGSITDADGDAFGFGGAALYLQYATSESFSLGVRGEYFTESNGGYGILGAYDMAGDANVLALTLSANAKVGNLTIIPEIRIDNASEDGAFFDNDLAPSSSLASFLLATVYSF
ncbi:MAG: porin [Saprospiraceae bacterium]